MLNQGNKSFWTFLNQAMHFLGLIEGLENYTAILCCKCYFVEILDIKITSLLSLDLSEGYCNCMISVLYWSIFYLFKLIRIIVSIYEKTAMNYSYS